MPRKKMIKRNTKASNTKAKNKFSQAALGKVEKEFFNIPGTLVKNATKQLTVLQKRTQKLNKTLSKTTLLVSKLEKRLSEIKQSKKAVKRAIVNALAKQHHAALKQQAALSKEHKEVTANLLPLETFHAKFSFLSKQLVQLDKEWATLQKNKSADKKTGKQTGQTEKKRLVKSRDATEFTPTTVSPLLSESTTTDKMETDAEPADEYSGS